LAQIEIAPVALNTSETDSSAAAQLL